MDKIKKIVITMIIFLIFILIIIGMLIFLFNKDTGTDTDTDEQEEQFLEESFNLNNKLERISRMDDYIFIKECINKYMDYSGNVKKLTDKDDVITIENTRNQLKSIIPQFVIDELKIKDEELYETIGIENKAYRLNNIYKSLQTFNTVEYIDKTSIYAYYIEGILIDKSNYQKQDLKLFIILDNINNTFLVVPQSYIESKNIDINISEPLTLYTQNIIENRVTNVFEIRDISREEICQNYISELKNSMIYDIDYLYNNILDAQYRENKFENIEQFKKYINQNYTNINGIELDKYKVKQRENYKEYICIDKNGEIYIFNEMEPMNYLLIMDTYTIDIEDFKEKYNKANDKTKVGMNIEKILEALNHKDYKYVYEHIDETYRNNNFANINIFENFITNKFFDKSEIKYIKLSEYNNIYIYEINVVNKQDNQQFNNIKIIMKLEEGTNFRFSIALE